MIALAGLELNIVHKLISEEQNYLLEPRFEPGAAGWEERMLPLCWLYNSDSISSNCNSFNRDQKLPRPW